LLLCCRFRSLPLLSRFASLLSHSIARAMESLQTPDDYIQSDDSDDESAPSLVNSSSSEHDEAAPPSQSEDTQPHHHDMQSDHPGQAASSQAQHPFAVGSLPEPIQVRTNQLPWPQHNFDVFAIETGAPMLGSMLAMFRMGTEGGMFGGDPLMQALQASLNMEQRSKPRPDPASMHFVLPCKVAKGDTVECPIGAEAVEEGMWAARMPCGHFFAHEPLEQWLGQNNSCPVCRFELPTNDAGYNSAKKLEARLVEDTMRAGLLLPADLIGSRMARARRDISEQMLHAALRALPPPPQAPKCRENPGTPSEGGAGNQLLQELHRERVERRAAEAEAEEEKVEAALVETLLEEQRRILRACAHHADPLLNVGLVPYGCA